MLLLLLLLLLLMMIILIIIIIIIIIMIIIIIIMAIINDNDDKNNDNDHEQSNTIGLAGAALRSRQGAVPRVQSRTRPAKNESHRGVVRLQPHRGVFRNASVGHGDSELDRCSAEVYTQLCTTFAQYGQVTLSSFLLYLRETASPCSASHTPLRQPAGHRVAAKCACHKLSGPGDQRKGALGVRERGGRAEAGLTTCSSCDSCDLFRVLLPCS